MYKRKRIVIALGGNALGNAIYSVYAALFHIFFA